jgi:predicted dehydrogenase
MQQKIRTAVIGVGYLGRFHAEKYAHIADSQLVAVCDTDADHREQCAAKFQVDAVADYQTLVGKVDAVSIAVPTQWHYEIAKFFLQNKVHVLVEKPITDTVEQAEELIVLAKKNNLILQVGHLERFNQAFSELLPVLKKPLFIESSRISEFKLRSANINVVLDMMIHDIDLIQHLVQTPIKNIYANGAAILSDKLDIANARIEFENGCVANVTASRAAAKTERKLRIFQDDSYISVDLQNKQFVIHRKGETEMLPGIPSISREEKVLPEGDALMAQICAFLSAIKHHDQPIVSGEDGKNALITAHKITETILG